MLILNTVLFHNQGGYYNSLLLQAMGILPVALVFFHTHSNFSPSLNTASFIKVKPQTVYQITYINVYAH